MSTTVGVRLEPQERALLEALARANDRTVSWYARQAIRAALEQDVRRSAVTVEDR